ncbi:NAD-dependent epimerase/dehydratase family protein [Streptomyces sp. NPDC057362]|uniref:NAD-dependent epimerase/dehydratase family protein n=1 Tax=Streptomyces sp. NPDC057362 TaxID=3346106 RepID=UPI00363761A4
MSVSRIVVTGATGFVGAAVMDVLLHHPDFRAQPTPVLCAVGRGPGPGRPVPSAVEWVTADLADPASLHGICEGADALLHLASSLSPRLEECTAVNVVGTGALMAEAGRAGVKRIVHLSTAAVYGAGPHRGLGVNEFEPTPASPASRTRLTGETYSLQAGATVLRPGLVVGPGDRWVVPALVELLERVPALWDSGRALLSMVHVTDLALLIARVGHPSAGPHGGGLFHASHPQPVRVTDLLARLAQRGVLPKVTTPLAWEACLEQFRKTTGRMSERQFHLLAQDHWYRSDDIWRIAGCPPGPGPVARL